MIKSQRHPFRIFIIVVFVFIFFLVGLKIGGDYTHSSTTLFEQAKSEFEEEIIKPNNDYQNKILYPEEQIPNKIAHQIDSIIQSVLNKVLSR